MQMLFCRPGIIANKKILYYLILLGLCFLVYVNSLKALFICDDIPGILKNPSLGKFAGAWTDPSALLNSLSYQLQGYSPFLYHFFSLILHGINTILVFQFLRLFFSASPSFWAASLFAVHPVHAEAVTWISGRPYLFLATFILITYLLYQRACLSLKADQRLHPFWYILSLCTFSYFMLSSYSFFCLLPLLLILSDIIMEKWRRAWKWWLPFIAIALFRLFLAQQAILQRASYISSETAAMTLLSKNPLVRFVNSVYGHAWLLLWPARLSLFRSPVIIPRFLLDYSVLLFIPIIVMLFLTYQRAKEVFLALGIFLIFLIPTYIPVALTSVAVADRYLYFPSLALSIIVAFLYQGCIRKYKKAQGFFLALLVFILFTLSLRTIVRNEEWSEPQRFWQATVKHSGQRAEAYINLGLAWMEKGDIQQAMVQYRKALEINPHSAQAYNNLGVAYAASRDKKGAIAFFEKALQLNPQLADAYNNLGSVYYELSNKDQAGIFFRQAIAADPLYAKAYYNLATLYAEQGDKKEAMDLYQRAIKANPGLTEAYINLAIVYSAASRTDEAIALYKKAAKIFPQNALIYYNLGNTYARLGQNERALPAYQRTVAINPQHAPAHFNLFVVYFSQKNFAAAIRHLDEAIQLGYSVPAEALKLAEPYRK